MKSELTTTLLKLKFYQASITDIDMSVLRNLDVEQKQEFYLDTSPYAKAMKELELPVGIAKVITWRNDTHWFADIVDPLKPEPKPFRLRGAFSSSNKVSEPKTHYCDNCDLKVSCNGIAWLRDGKVHILDLCFSDNVGLTSHIVMHAILDYMIYQYKLRPKNYNAPKKMYPSVFTDIDTPIVISYDINPTLADWLRAAADSKVVKSNFVTINGIVLSCLLNTTLIDAIDDKMLYDIQGKLPSNYVDAVHSISYGSWDKNIANRLGYPDYNEELLQVLIDYRDTEFSIKGIIELLRFNDEEIPIENFTTLLKDILSGTYDYDCGEKLKFNCDPIPDRDTVRKMNEALIEKVFAEEESKEEDSVVESMEEDSAVMEPTIIEEELELDLEPVRNIPEIVLPEGFYFDCNEENNYVLHYIRSDGRNCKSSIKCKSDDEAKEVLFELHKLFNGESSDNKKAVQIFKRYNKKDDVVTYEELVKLYESEIADLKKEIDSIKEENNQLRKDNYVLTSRVESLTDTLSTKDEHQEEMLVTELWPGELKHFIRLSAEYCSKQWQIDGNLRRGVDVVNEYLSNTEESDYPEVVYNTLYSVFTNSSSFETKQAICRSIGFGLEYAGSDHYKLYCLGNDTYYATLSNTPSDFRGRANGLKLFTQMLFK